MTINHYENFPVASLLLPAKLRPAVHTIYAFARNADDFADEGQLSDEERIVLLQNYESQLSHIEQALSPQDPLFVELAKVIQTYQIPTSLFFDLLSAFKQDIKIKTYESFDDLIAYCSRSANPVGRIMLQLFGQKTELQLIQSDYVCTALQLINFWQDVAIDLQMGRVYLPQEDLREFGINNLSEEAQALSPAWQKLMQYQIRRARQYMLEGAPLTKTLTGRFGFEIRMVIQGGLRILEKIEDVQYDVFKKRPKLNKLDGVIMLWRALRM